jgi:hypothetical protein
MNKGAEVVSCGAFIIWHNYLVYKGIQSFSDEY